jgi:hypothetical protein
LFGAGATCYAPVPVPVVVRAVKGFSEIAWADLGVSKPCVLVGVEGSRSSHLTLGRGVMTWLLLRVILHHP